MRSADRSENNMSLDADDCCRVLPLNTSYMVSHESLYTHRTYVSTTAPSNRDDYHTVKEALIRANSEEAASGDVVLISNNKGHRYGTPTYTGGAPSATHSPGSGETSSMGSDPGSKGKYVRSTVISRTFQLSDSQSRGFTRRCHLLFVVSERFCAVEMLPDVQRHFGEVISILKEKAQDSYDRDVENNKKPIQSRYTEDYRFYDKGLRSPPQLLQFDTLHIFLHDRFSRLHHHLETKYDLVSVVQPDKIDEMERERKMFCVCIPSSTSDTSPCSFSRDRAQTLVEFPAVKFGDLFEVRDLMGVGEFRTLLHHIVIGDQVVVRGSHNATIDSLLLILTMLLPPKCIKNFGFRQKYEAENLCNFIGVPASADLPDSPRIVVLDLTASSDDCRYLRSFDLRISVSKPAVLPVPTIVEELLNLVNLSRNQRSETFRKCLKAELKRWTTRALTYYLAMKVKLKTEPEEEAAFLDCFQCRKRDVPVLRFFISAYNKGEKLQLLKEVQ